MAVRLVVDSASDINLEEANKLGIDMVPLEIRFGSESYLDGVTITPHMFYEKLIESSELPKTSQANPYLFQEVYKKYKNDDIIVITMSSKLSGTYNSARHAAKEFSNVYVVDSLNLCVGERLLIEYAIRLINSGYEALKVVDMLEVKKHDICVLGLLNTLQYLKKGGRISALKAISGELLSIKPVISVVKGEIKLVGKARGSKNGNNLLNVLVTKTGAIDFDMPYGVVYSGFDDTLLRKYIEDSKALWENKISSKIELRYIGCTIGTHVGPGAIALAYFKKK